MVQPNSLHWNLEDDITQISNNKGEHIINFKWELLHLKGWEGFGKSLESDGYLAGWVVKGPISLET